MNPTETAARFATRHGNDGLDRLLSAFRDGVSSTEIARWYGLTPARIRQLRAVLATATPARWRVVVVGPNPTVSEKS